MVSLENSEEWILGNGFWLGDGCGRIAGKDFHSGQAKFEETLEAGLHLGPGGLCGKAQAGHQAGVPASDHEFASADA
jgi:hypothetical protein